jgi:hypothetical protein
MISLKMADRPKIVVCIVWGILVYDTHCWFLDLSAMRIALPAEQLCVLDLTAPIFTAIYVDKTKCPSVVALLRIPFVLVFVRHNFEIVSPRTFQI